MHEDGRLSGETSHWETLKEFWDTCEKHEFSNQ
jgi:hypothetical protein